MWMLLPQVNFGGIPIYKNGGEIIFEFGDRLNPPHWPPGVQEVQGLQLLECMDMGHRFRKPLRPKVCGSSTSRIISTKSSWKSPVFHFDKIICNWWECVAAKDKRGGCTVYTVQWQCCNVFVYTLYNIQAKCSKDISVYIKSEVSLCTMSYIFSYIQA